MKIPTWGWVLIALTLITVAIIAFRKPLKAWMDKRKAANATTTPTTEADGTGSATMTPATVSTSESTLSKMRRVA